MQTSVSVTSNELTALLCLVDEAKANYHDYLMGKDDDGTQLGYAGGVFDALIALGLAPKVDVGISELNHARDKIEALLNE